MCYTTGAAARDLAWHRVHGILFDAAHVDVKRPFLLPLTLPIVSGSGVHREIDRCSSDAFRPGPDAQCALAVLVVKSDEALIVRPDAKQIVLLMSMFSDMTCTL